jgi:hypothetical protein
MNEGSVVIGEATFRKVSELRMSEIEGLKESVYVDAYGVRHVD